MSQAPTSALESAAVMHTVASDVASAAASAIRASVSNPSLSLSTGQGHILPPNKKKQIPSLVITDRISDGSNAIASFPLSVCFDAIFETD